MENLTDVHEPSSEAEELDSRQDTLEPQPQGGALKRSKFPTYEGFDGRFRRAEEVRERLPAFRDFYMTRMAEADAMGLNDGEGLKGGKKKNKLSAIKIVDMFNAQLPEDQTKDFFPETGMYRRWRKRWDAERDGRLQNAEERVERAQKRELMTHTPGTVPSLEHLEDGMSTLAGELANDALETLRDTNEREEYFDDEVVVKRKMYALNVFAYVTKAVHSKQALDLKKHAEGRETAGFMLDILRRATAGKITAEELALLRGSATPVHANSVPTSAA